ncbi:hypothetical protein C1Y63_04705 [Corynebacterium sp. 13CS0277]|uniref:ImmA/IrrE family metallo-endopeptidase n=1 Tax=Corynebacterium sp. 13CS0277 TaxID=2071994 RepID=UPI000D03321E|nr:ImmA/IrrE family metallo-endopeptidase [Corynebacterium sp. 13CS0277]PRQ11712.1 hypothetical protein C1Y63_04705 [Corynebacterium sp. 13CS0277]
MTTTPTSPQRIKDLRAYLNLHQEQLADLLGVPQSMVSYAERGERDPQRVIERARRLPDTPEGFFDRPTPTYTADDLNLRLKKLPKVTERGVVATFAEIEATARAAITHPWVPVAVDAGQRTTALPLQAIEEIAQRTRNLLRVEPTGPVHNVTRAMATARIPVAKLANPHLDLSKIDGVSSPWDASQRPVVATTECEDGGRVRFTRAHELGHLVLHSINPPTDVRVREDEANLFAGAFLLPETDARAAVSAGLRLEGYGRVKSQYLISLAATVQRARALGIIDADRHLSLRKQLSSRGWTRKEPIRIPVERYSFAPTSRPPQQPATRPHLRVVK